MVSLSEKNIEEQKSLLLNGSVILYGAGFSGRTILYFLQRHGITVKFFVDDDVMKQGSEISGVECISFAQMKDISKKENIHIIISSLYAKAILKELEILNVNIYECFDLLVDKTSIEFMRRRQKSMQVWKAEWKEIQNFLSDEESKAIWSVLYDFAVGKNVSYQQSFEISSSEDHYFVDPIPLLLNENSVLIDCGAYTGDMLGQIQRKHILFKTLYAIEANPKVYHLLVKNSREMNIKGKVVPINMAIHDHKGNMSFVIPNRMDSAGRLSAEGDSETESYVTVDTIDHIIDEPIDYFKTDLEGADLPALKGAKNQLVESRPILAISIYHSLDDVVDIPLYLYNLLPDYTFFLRHHSFSMGETVLYGIPKELLLSR